MEISNKLVSNTEKPEFIKQTFGAVSQNVNNNAENFQSELPNSHSIGQSMVNSSIPIGYTKIAEIDIPGLKDKASVFKLDNGQKIVICPKKGPTHIKTTYNVGSLNETEDIRGISHYIEHNLFNGSKDLAPKEYDKIVSSLGGGTNASTSFAATDYYISLQLLEDNFLDKAVWLNAMQTQFPTFITEQLQKEKEPVKSEIDVYKDMPSDIATCRTLKNLFNIKSNSTNFILGTKDNINSFTRDKVFEYFNTWYTPDNAVTVITGDVDTDEAINIVSKYYNKKTDLSKINQRHYETLEYIQHPIRQDIILPNSTSPMISMGFAIPEGTTKEENRNINTLLSILTSSNSRISKALDKYGISLNAYVEKMQNKPDGAKAIMFSVNPTEENIEDILKIIYEEIAYIANNPPTYDELNAVKKQALNGINNISESSNYLNSTLSAMLIENDLNYFEDAKRNIQMVTPQDISQIARKFLDLNKVSICVSHQNNANTDSINKNYNIAHTKSTYMSGQGLGNISFGASISPIDSINEEAKKVKQYRLPNNIELTTIPGSLTAQSNLLMDFKSDELNNIPAPAFRLLNEMLNRGSLFRNKEEYSKIMNANDLGLYFSTGIDGLSITSIFSDENINDAFVLLKETLLYPNLTEAEFQRAKQIAIDEINQESTGAIDILMEELVPSVRAYASKEQRLQELNALTLQDIKNLYSIIMQTAKVNSAFTGPLENKPYLENIVYGQLSSGMPVYKPYTLQKGASYNIYQPNQEPKIVTAAQEQAQADIIQAYKYKKPENVNDIAKISILEYILGGSMSSRLFTDLRENKKLAYYVDSSINNTKDTEYIQLHIATTTDSPDPNEGSPKNITIALDGFNQNVELLKNEYVSEKELENAKTTLKSIILDDLETNTGKSVTFLTSKDTPYNMKYKTELLKAIDNATVEDIKDAANFVFKDAPITSIVASQRTLDALNL